jgi:threonine synthase
MSIDKINLKCINCGKKFDEEEKRVFCDCGGFLNLEFYPIFEKEKIDKKRHGLWRYREFLPILDEKYIVSMGEGLTPLIKINLYELEIFLKLDFIFPTGSFKDRGSTILISKIKELGIKRVVEDSSGNAGASIASYSAFGGIECDIFVPETASKNKIKQIEFFNANLHKLHLSREDVHLKAREFAKNFYYASHFLNPYFFQGTKTVIYEIFEEMNFKLPDSIIIPIGNGSLIIGIMIALKDLMRSKLIDSYPKIVGVQSENCSPIYEAYKRKIFDIPKIEKKNTIAEGIAISNPLRGKEILKIIYETDGEVITVNEEEILIAQKELGKLGIFVEPTSSVQFAGFKKYIKNLNKKESIVIILTGSGLKSL